MHVALDARVSTADTDQHPETQLRPLREHLAARAATDAGAFVDHASADTCGAARRGAGCWRSLTGDSTRKRVPV